VQLGRAHRRCYPLVLIRRGQQRGDDRDPAALAEQARGAIRSEADALGVA
jgi:hypothetical protein